MDLEVRKKICNKSRLDYKAIQTRMECLKQNGLNGICKTCSFKKDLSIPYGCSCFGENMQIQDYELLMYIEYLERYIKEVEKNADTIER